MITGNATILTENCHNLVRHHKTFLVLFQGADEQRAQKATLFNTIVITYSKQYEEFFNILQN